MEHAVGCVFPSRYSGARSLSGLAIARGSPLLIFPPKVCNCVAAVIRLARVTGDHRPVAAGGLSRKRTPTFAPNRRCARCRASESIARGRYDGFGHPRERFEPPSALRAFVDDATLERMDRRLERARYRTHEFGDSILVERHADEGPGPAERPGSADSFGRAPIPPQRPRIPCRNFSRSSGVICAQRSAIRSRQCMP